MTSQVDELRPKPTTVWVILTIAFAVACAVLFIMYLNHADELDRANMTRNLVNSAEASRRLHELKRVSGFYMAGPVVAGVAFLASLLGAWRSSRHNREIAASKREE